MAADVPLQHRRRRQSPGRPARHHEIRISELVHADGVSQTGKRNAAIARHVQPRTVYVRAWRLALTLPNRRDLQRATNNRQTTPPRFLDGIVSAIHPARRRARNLVHILWLSG